MNITQDQLTQEQQQDIINELYTLDELNQYINYMISSSIKLNKPDND